MTTTTALIVSQVLLALAVLIQMARIRMVRRELLAEIKRLIERLDYLQNDLDAVDLQLSMTRARQNRLNFTIKPLPGDVCQANIGTQLRTFNDNHANRSLALH